MDEVESSSPDRGRRRGTRIEQAAMPLSSSSKPRYSGTCRAMSNTAK